MVPEFFAAIFLILCLVAATYDVGELIIPNWLNGWLAFLFIPAAILVAPGWGTVGAHLIVGAIAFAACVALFLLGVFGGGDAKMIPGVILWLGPTASGAFLLWMAMAGAVLAIFLMFARMVMPPRLIGTGIVALQQGQGIPYGVAIAFGAVMAAPQSPFLANFLSQISGFN